MLYIKISQMQAIKEAFQYLELDLDIVTKDGAIIRANKLLLSLSSPFLHNLLTCDHDRLYLPDVSATGIIHLINVIKNGFMTGLGPGYSTIKEIRNVAELLGFQNIPLTFEVQTNYEDFVQNAPVGSNEDMDDTLPWDDTMDNMEPGYNMAMDDNQDKGMDGNPVTYRLAVDPCIETGDTILKPREMNIMIEVKIGEDSNDGPNDIPIFNEGPNPNDIPISNKRKDCEVTEDTWETFNRNQEVRETIPKVLKIEPAHEDDDTDTSDVPMFPCGVCSKMFSNAGTLLSHFDQHGDKGGKKKCPLAQCNFSGPRSSVLSHIRAKHTKEKLFSCSFCHQKFHSCHSQKNHERTHR